MAQCISAPATWTREGWCGKARITIQRPYIFLETRRPICGRTQPRGYVWRPPLCLFQVTTTGSNGREPRKPEINNEGMIEVPRGPSATQRKIRPPTMTPHRPPILHSTPQALTADSAAGMMRISSG